MVNLDEREINSLIHQFSLEQDFIRAALDEEESSRIETEDGNTLIILDARGGATERRGLLLHPFRSGSWSPHPM